MIKKKTAAAPGAKAKAASVSKTGSKPVPKTAAKVVKKAAPRTGAEASAVAKIPMKPVGTPAAKRATEAASGTATRTTTAVRANVRPAKKSPPAGSQAEPATTLVSKTLRSDGAANGSLLDISDRPRKPKLVRDSFTMPEAEYAALGEVKKACLKAGYEVKKSELLRVGVGLIRTMDIVALKDILAALPPLKAGRPKKS